MAPFADDPEHVVLRRAVRAAIAVPAALAVALLLLEDSDGALFAVIGTLGLLVNADFAGRPRQRFTAYVTTGIVGGVVLAVAWAASGTTWVAVPVTLVLTFALGFTAFLRGGTAIGTSAVLLVFVVAITSDADPGSLLQFEIGWWCAVVIATVTALALLPRDSHGGIRRALADVFDAAAVAARMTWLAADPKAGEAASAILATRLGRLDEEYGGQRSCLPGLAEHDQALEVLVVHLDNTRLLLTGPLPQRPAIASASGQRLAGELATALADLARAMRDRSYLPSGQALDAARGEFRDDLQMWVADAVAQGSTPAEVAERLSAENPLRMAAVLVEQMTECARIANHGTVESLEHEPPVPTRTWRRVLRSQLSLRSSWTRHAARRALAMAIAVLVVDLVGVQHGFWVLLGTISVLRFDAAGTRDIAWRAIAATGVGAAAAVALLLVFNANPDWLWLLLPIAVFLAAWSGAALGYAAGQAAFTALVLIAVGIIHWPEPPSLALIRLEDVAIGAVVALVVALLLWPRGAVGAVRQRLAESTQLAGAFLGRAVGSFTAPDATLHQARLAAILAIDRAVETIELARLQQGAGPDAHDWARRVTSPYVLVTAGRLVASLAPKYAALPTSSVLAGALGATRTANDEHWSQVAAAIAADRTATVVPVPGTTELDLGGVRIDGVDAATAFVLAAWTIDWVACVSRLPSLRPVPTPAPAPAGTGNANRLSRLMGRPGG